MLRYYPSWSQDRELCLAAKRKRRRNEAQKKKEKAMKKFVLALMVLALFTMTGAAFAVGTATTNLSVTADVQNACRISTGPGTVNFGSYDPTAISDNTAGTTSFQYQCTQGTTNYVYITRTNVMTDGSGNNLNYSLYSDAGMTTVFPKQKSEVTSPPTSSNNSPVTVNIYGKIAAQQNVPAGSYSETDTITVEW
jgi:spore coat protein U-like protein